MSDESIFAEALAIDNPANRASYLDRACAGDADLRAEVEALLAAHVAGSPLDRAPANLAPTELPQHDRPLAEVGDQIGPYRVMEQIGEGGFGLVFVAEQHQPIRRQVALKVVKPGMDTREVIARFEAERQALAMMDHPNIAKVFDAGSTENGRPYFVMELVHGIPITQYCDQQKLSTKQRLALFAHVCDAIQHAHQKGIIHRDLKPSNVLVAPHDGKPVVKVIDFGVAKAVGQSLTDKTIYTRFTQMIGTPLYMSPEQAEINQLKVDTRSDIYSLGVLLYELLTGTTPLDQERLRTAAYDEIRRLIREEEPPKPSTRLSALGETLSTVSTNRGTEPTRLTGLVRGELDWIVMKCLEKDRSRRYETAVGLAKDVQRYLDGQPVEACPPTFGYQLKKLYQRNRVAVLTTSAIAIAMLLGTIVSTQQAIRAIQAERRLLVELKRATTAEQAARTQLKRAQQAEVRATKSEQDLQAAVDFLWGDILAQFSPENSPNGELKVRTILDRACEELDGGSLTSPDVEATIRSMAGEVYIKLGNYVQSQEQLRKALMVLKRELGPDDLKTLAAQEELARALTLEGHSEQTSEEAILLLTDAWEKRSRLQGAAHRSSFKNLNKQMTAYFRVGRFEQMEKVGRRALEIAVKEHGENSLVTARKRLRLAGIIMRWEKFSEAEDLIRRASSVMRKQLDPGDEKLLYCDTVAANLPFYRARFAEGVELAIPLYHRTEQRYGEVHPFTISSIDFICLNYLLGKNFAAAKPWLDKLRKRNLRANGENHPRNTRMFWLIGVYHLGKGNVEEAETALRKALSIFADHPVPRYGFVQVIHAATKSSLGECRLRRKDLPAAEKLLLESQQMLDRIGRNSAGRELWERDLVPKHLRLLVRLYDAMGNAEEAARWRKKLEHHRQ